MIPFIFLCPLSDCQYCCPSAASTKFYANLMCNDRATFLISLTFLYRQKLAEICHSANNLELWR